MTGAGTRERSLAEADGASVDLLVIGAGVIGAGTAWHAARAGATVVVVDRGDLAGATSSASSKLLHGGLRYLGMGDVGLVREAHAERRANARVIAPHLVRPLPFVVPVRDGSPVPLWKVRAGVLLYGALSRFADGRSGRIPDRRAAELVPALRRDGLHGTVLYHDHETHDGRLALSALRAAADAGAVVLPHAEVVRLVAEGGRVRGAELTDRLGGRRLRIEARAVVNATGPWVDAVRRLEDAGAGPSVRLSKGVHLVLEGARDWSAAVTTPLPGGRVSFAIPWEGMLLLGTTDEPYDGDPGAVRATDADERQILAEAAFSVDPAVLDPGRVRARLAGLRVLPLVPGETSRARRETIVARGPQGMISVAGGKLTTWRAIGRRAAGLALAGIGGSRPPADPMPLPGAAAPAIAERRISTAWPGLPIDIVMHLARHHGLLGLDVLAAGHNHPVLLDRIHPDGPDIWAQVVYARDREWASTVTDVLRGRTTVALRGLDTDDVRRGVERILGGGSGPA